MSAALSRESGFFRYYQSRWRSKPFRANSISTESLSRFSTGLAYRESPGASDNNAWPGILPEVTVGRRAIDTALSGSPLSSPAP